MDFPAEVNAEVIWFSWDTTYCCDTCHRVYISIEGVGHSGSQFETIENLQKVIAFLDKYLK